MVVLFTQFYKALNQAFLLLVARRELHESPCRRPNKIRFPFKHFGKLLRLLTQQPGHSFLQKINISDFSQ